jgi:hypothetical protein
MDPFDDCNDVWRLPMRMQILAAAVLLASTGATFAAPGCEGGADTKGGVCKLTLTPRPEDIIRELDRQTTASVPHAATGNSGPKARPGSGGNFDDESILRPSVNFGVDRPSSFSIR